MRVDPMMRLNEAITSLLEAIAYPSMVMLVVLFLVVGSAELRSRSRRPELKSEAGGRTAPHDRDSRRRSDRVAPATRERPTHPRADSPTRVAARPVR